jgi:hypothetical protein
VREIRQVQEVIHGRGECGLYPPAPARRRT